MSAWQQGWDTFSWSIDQPAENAPEPKYTPAQIIAKFTRPEKKKKRWSIRG